MLLWLVRTENLTRLLQVASRAVDYRFDEWDEDAITLGLEDTGAAAGAWYEYELYGRETISLRLAQATGGRVAVEARAPVAVETGLSPIAETSDREIVEQVYRAFAAAPRPEHPVNYRHCPECEGHDSLMRERTWGTLTPHDVRYTWSPVRFLTPEGFRYWLPAFMRLVLEWHDDPDREDEIDIVNQLFSCLAERSSSMFECLTSGETAAVVRFLQHVAWWRPDLVENVGAFDKVAETWGAAWSPKCGGRDGNDDLPAEEKNA